jgi:radical SAM superfamily enzyme YgiQ (UPF0313 family)
MKVIIINSPLFRETNHCYDEDSLPPIGLGYIATALKANGFDVALIDSIDQRIPLVELINILEQRKPNFIGINIFTTNYELVKELVEPYPYDCHFVIGGLSTKDLYKQILKWETPNPIDIVTGDGERIMVDIVKGNVDQQPFLEKGNRRVFIVDIQSPYLVKDISEVGLDRSFFKNEPIKHPLGFYEANIVASRGCIYNCTFCAAARSLNKDYPVRERSVSSIRTEIQEIIDQYPHVQSIRVLDDLFLKSNATIKTAADSFLGFNIQWRAMAHVQTFKQASQQLMENLKASGCFELFVGIESGSPRILSEINKTKDLHAIIENLTKVFRAGIHMKGYFIYGFPGETEADMTHTYDLASHLKQLAAGYGVNFRTSVFQYRPYHSSQIYHDLEAEGHQDLNQINMVQNEQLSGLVGRYQFNFHSGNYSKVSQQLLEAYICRTIQLNGDNIFAGLAG